jgi:hypothetical protein
MSLWRWTNQVNVKCSVPRLQVNILRCPLNACIWISCNWQVFYVKLHYDYVHTHVHVYFIEFVWGAVALITWWRRNKVQCYQMGNYKIVHIIEGRGTNWFTCQQNKFCASEPTILVQMWTLPGVNAAITIYLRIRRKWPFFLKLCFYHFVCLNSTTSFELKRDFFAKLKKNRNIDPCSVVVSVASVETASGESSVTTTTLWHVGNMPQWLRNHHPLINGWNAKNQ